jgi:hypothetical protein
MLAIDSNGVILAIYVGSIPAPLAEIVSSDLLFGHTLPLYTRITSADVRQIASSTPKYEFVQLSPRSTFRFPGLHYRVIAMTDMAIRVTHEIDPSAAVFVDCKSVRTANACQGALLALAGSRPPEKLFGIDMPRREDLRP